MYGCGPCILPPKTPKVKVLLDCDKKALCDPLRSLVMDWSVDFSFAAGSDLATRNFQAVGLFSQCHGDIDSVAQKYLGNLNRPPQFSDLEGARIKIQIPGVKGSTCVEDCGDFYPYGPSDCNVEVYFFGQGANVDKYHAILKTELLSTGNEMVCRVKEIESGAEEDRPIDLIFVAVLRYIVQPVKSTLKNTFNTPPPFGELD